MEDIPMKECYKPTFEVMSQSQVVLEGEHLCPERKRMQQDLQRESLKDVRES